MLSNSQASKAVSSQTHADSWQAPAGCVSSCLSCRVQQAGHPDLVHYQLYPNLCPQHAIISTYVPAPGTTSPTLMCRSCNPSKPPSLPSPVRCSTAGPHYQRRAADAASGSCACSPPHPPQPSAQPLWGRREHRTPTTRASREPAPAAPSEGPAGPPAAGIADSSHHFSQPDWSDVQATIRVNSLHPPHACIQGLGNLQMVWP